LSFGSMGVLAKLAYGAGASVMTLLAVRFAIGAGLLWAFAASRGVARIDARRAAGAALGLGLFLYSAESGLYATALTHIDASLAELLMFTYPALVVTAAIVLRREPPSRRRIGAVAIASTGVVLVLLGGSTGAIDPVGVGLALAAALLYATYVLTTHGLGGQLHPLTFSALVCTGAAIAFTTFGTASGQLHVSGVHAEAWLWIAVIAVLSTAVGMTAFIAGVERLGPSRASIMSALDPIVAVVTASLVFGDRLGPVQLLGALMVVSAVVVLQLPAVKGLRARAGGRARAALAVARPRRMRGGTVVDGAPAASHVQRRPVCEPERAGAGAGGWEPVGSQERGASTRPAPQPSAGSLALVTSERR
jgi:drug/metabolite transporter (DMT)-like permease